MDKANWFDKFMTANKIFEVLGIILISIIILYRTFKNGSPSLDSNEVP
jgi:hypothetical protein